MREVTSDDPVYISWAEAILKAEGIKTVRVDPPSAQAWGLTPSEPIFSNPRRPLQPYRLIVTDEDWENARAILEAAKPT